MSSDPQHVEEAYQLLESFKKSLERLGATQQFAAKMRMRPAALRISSFFTQAVELMRRGAASPGGG